MTNKPTRNGRQINPKQISKKIANILNVEKEIKNEVKQLKPRKLKKTNQGKINYKAMPMMVDDSQQNYLKMVLDPRHSNLSLFPLFGWDPYHITKRTFTITANCNASGLQFFDVCPSALAAFDSTNSSAGPFPVILLSNSMYTTYNPNSNFLDGGMGLVTQDIRAGLLLNSDHHSAIVTAFHLRITATGTSTANRQGMITIVEYVDDQLATPKNDITVPGGANNLSAYISDRSYSNMINRPKVYEVDIATAYANSIDYTWSPNFNHNNVVDYESDIGYNAVGNTFIDDNNPYKKVCVFVHGATTSTQIRYEMTAVYQTIPKHNKLTSFPVRYCENFRDITIPLMKLGQKVRIKESTGGGNHAYIGAVYDGLRKDGGGDNNNNDSNKSKFMINNVTESEYEDSDEIMYINKEKGTILPEFYEINKTPHTHKIGKTKTYKTVI